MINRPYSRQLIRLGIVFLSAWCLLSCTVDTECRQQIDVLLGIQLQGDSLRLNADSTDYEHVSFTQVSGMAVYGAERDSLIEDGSKSFKSLSLPLRKTSDTTAYVFCYRGLQDTLLLTYTRENKYISLACGCAVQAVLDTVYSPTAFFIDSIEIKNAAVTTVKETHIQLYFHLPQTTTH